MKKFLVLFLLSFCVHLAFAQNSLNLDDSIEEVANFLSARIPPGTRVAVFDFSSDTRKLSDYIVDELTIALTNTGMDVYDRKNLDTVNREIKYGDSDAVAENTAQQFGRDVGVQTVVLGSFMKSGTVYKLTVKAIVVETKAVQAGRTINVKQDAQLLSLLNLTVQKEYRFTSAQKTQAGFRNMLFGWGSFAMGDPLGGATVLVPEAGSIVVLVIGVISFGGAEGKAIEEIQMNHTTNTQDFRNESARVETARRERTAELQKTAAGLMIGGGAGLLLSWTWGFVRPYLYDQPLAVQKVAGVIDHLHIGLVPTSNATTNVNVMLRYQY